MRQLTHQWLTGLAATVRQLRETEPDEKIVKLRVHTLGTRASSVSELLDELEVAANTVLHLKA